MLFYLIRRIALALPTLLIISLVAFGLSQYTDSDPVRVEYAENSGAYLAKARQLDLDKPAFYLSLHSLALPDTLHRILPLEHRERLVRLTEQCGNWDAVFRYGSALDTALLYARQSFSGTAFLAFLELRQSSDLTKIPGHLALVRQHLDSLQNPGEKSAWARRMEAVQTATADMKATSQRWKLLVPVLHWHGLDNRYHKWLSGFLSGNPGTSVVTGNPLLVELRPRLLVTLLLNGSALLLAYLLGVPLGVYMAQHHHQPADRVLRPVLLFLYAMPVMWLGSLLILLLARQDIGLGLLNGMNAEPWLLSGKSFWRWAADNTEKFVLPVLTLTLHAVAILAMQMRGGILEVVQQDFIRTARAKGLSERLVFWRHAFRNGLFPIITVFATFFPSIFGGSLVIEYLFDFPGMGTKMVLAFANNDYAVLFAMVLFSSVVTIAGTLIADVLYAWADPRVRFEKQNANR